MIAFARWVHWKAGVAVALAGLLVALAFDPRSALAGWLIGLVLLSSFAIGGLGIAMMMRLIPGRWAAELQPQADRLATLMPLAALAALPLIIGAPWLYPWAAADGFSYLSVPGFTARGVVILVLLAALGAAVAGKRGAVAISAAGLILLPLAGTVLAVDWLMSLDPSFSSSGFGLYVLSMQFTIAVSAMLLMRMRSRAPEAVARLGGSLLLTALLLWAYFAFMQYFIIWSGDLPHGVRWYRMRGGGIWSAAEYAIALSGLLPAVFLLFAPLRADPRLICLFALTAIAGRWLEIVWLVLPGIAETPVAMVSAAVISLGLGLAAADGPCFTTARMQGKEARS